MQAGNCKIACVGAGNWGLNHVRNLAQLNSLAMIVEPDQQRASHVQSEFPGTPVIDDLRVAAADKNIDALVIATPVPTHFDIAMSCLQAGKDLLVEKPITLFAHEARQLANLAEANNRILMTGHLLLFQPAIQFIKHQLADGLLGEVFTLHLIRRNLGRARSAENALWSLGVHDVAIIYYLLEQVPRRVLASGHCGLQQTIEDNVYLSLEFPNRTHAHLHCSWLWPERQRSMLITGSKGMLSYDEITRQVCLINKSINGTLENVDHGSELLFEDAGQPLRLELEHFINCICTREEPVSNGQHAAAVISILEAAQQQLTAARS